MVWKMVLCPPMVKNNKNAAPPRALSNNKFGPLSKNCTLIIRGNKIGVKKTNYYILNFTSNKSSIIILKIPLQTDPPFRLN